MDRSRRDRRADSQLVAVIEGPLYHQGSDGETRSDHPSEGEAVPMSDRPERKPWWCRFRFRLRNLMIAIGIFCGILGWIINRARVQRDAVAAIELAGGKVMYDGEWTWKKYWPVPTGSTRWPHWLVERIGIDHLSNVTYVDLRSCGSDELLARVGQLRGLKYLTLAGSRVTDARLANLRGLTDLEWLSLDDTQISDDGLVYLTGLRQLQTLSLGLTRVSDAGLPHLKMLTRLKRLSLYLTEVSDDAGRDLQRALPGTRISATGWPGRNQARAIELHEKAEKTKTDR
jgi:hypothetical protein